MHEKQWRVINTLNNKGKNLGLCKFTRDVRKQTYEKIVMVYAFNKAFVERLDFSRKPEDLKWEEIKIKNPVVLNSVPISF